MDRAKGKPAYTVATDATLQEVLRTRPSSAQELIEIRGIGPAFCEKHGPPLLAAVAELSPARDRLAFGPTVASPGADVAQLVEHFTRNEGRTPDPLRSSGVIEREGRRPRTCRTLWLVSRDDRPLFGLGLEAGVHQLSEMLDHARLADESGLDVLSVGDHPYFAERLDAYAALAFVLGATSNIAGAVIRTNLQPSRSRTRQDSHRPVDHLSRSLHTRIGRGRDGPGDRRAGCPRL